MAERSVIMAEFRKIGVLTSGGDAPGMNACIKAVVNKALARGIEVVGVVGGYAGLINGDLIPLTNQSVNNIVARGGTMLYSSRCPEFKTEKGINTAVKTCRENNIDALVCIGGDGTFRGATDMTNHGIPSIGLPGTIDNDITATDNTIGFSTAVNTALKMIDCLRDTCESHERLNVVEVMGRECGQCALYTAIASGAVAVAIPEVPFDEAAAIEKIRTLRKEGKRSMIVLVAEGVTNPDGTPYAETLAKRIEEQTGVETKFVRPAHILRGGSPVMKDRTVATAMGVKAVELLLEGRSNLVMCEIDSNIVPMDINFALITDRMYKNKLKDGDLDAFTPEQLGKMRTICHRRTEELNSLYKIALDASF